MEELQREGAVPNSLNADAALRERGKGFRQFVWERYWQEKFLARPNCWTWNSSCRSRSGRTRKKHDFDRDRRCFFCDYLKPLPRPWEKEEEG